MKRLLFLALVAAAAAATPSLAQDQSASQDHRLVPGYWEAHTTFLGLISKTERWCIQPKDIKRFLGGISNHNYKCTYPLNEAEDGVIHFKGACVDKSHKRIDLQGDGTYTTRIVHMRASGSTHLLGLPITGDASVDAHFLSDDCPADAKRFK